MKCMSCLIYLDTMLPLNMNLKKYQNYNGQTEVVGKYSHNHIKTIYQILLNLAATKRVTGSIPDWNKLIYHLCDP